MAAMLGVGWGVGGHAKRGSACVHRLSKWSTLVNQTLASIVPANKRQVIWRVIVGYLYSNETPSESGRDWTKPRSNQAILHEETDISLAFTWYKKPQADFSPVRDIYIYISCKICVLTPSAHVYQWTALNNRFGCSGCRPVQTGRDQCTWRTHSNCHSSHSQGSEHTKWQN